MVHIVAVGDLRRATVATAVMGNNAIAMAQKEQQLRVPIIGRQRPAVAEHDRLAQTPVLVEDLSAILGGNGGHVDSWEKAGCLCNCSTSKLTPSGSELRLRRSG